MNDADRDAAILAEWKRQGLPTDYMDGGQRHITAWERAAFDAGLASATIPREPTREMLMAHLAVWQSNIRGANEYARAAWQAMWDAAQHESAPLFGDSCAYRAGYKAALEAAARECEQRWRDGYRGEVTVGFAHVIRKLAEGLG